MKINLYATGKKYDVKGCYERDSLTVLKGSKLSLVTTFGNQRDEMVKNYCTKGDNFFILVKDIVFQTPTAAANFCTGGSVNGWDFWKNSSKVPLKSLVEHKIVKRPRKKNYL